jgi:hypothetical protein
VKSTWSLPWRSDREFGETVILGRQAITLMSLTLLVATGLLLDLENIGVWLAWYAFQIGAWWVACVDLPDEVDPGTPGGASVHEPRRPTPQSPQRGVAVFATELTSVWTDSGDLALPVGFEADGPHRVPRRDRAQPTA